MKKQILVLCTANRCRSQMAEGWLRHYAGDQADVYSAGVKPSEVHPLAIEVMAEVDIDLSAHYSKNVDQFLDMTIDHVITVCDSAKEACPTFPSAGNIWHQSFDDPDQATGSDEQILAVFRRVRDEISLWAREFTAEHLKNDND